MFTLPNEILVKIFEYDDTYKRIFQEKVLLEIWRSSWSRFISRFNLKEKTLLNYVFGHYLTASSYKNFYTTNLFTNTVNVHSLNVDEYTQIRISNNLYRVFTKEQFLNVDEYDDHEHFLQIFSNDELILFQYFH